MALDGEPASLDAEIRALQPGLSASEVDSTRSKLVLATAVQEMGIRPAARMMVGRGRPFFDYSLPCHLWQGVSTTKARYWDQKARDHTFHAGLPLSLSIYANMCVSLSFCTVNGFVFFSL